MMPQAEPASEDAKTLSDSDLLARFTKSREEMAFCALIERNGPLVWHVCARILGRQQDQDIEDAFQATFLVLLEKANRVRDPDALPSWLYGVACRTSLRLRRQRRHRQEFEIDPTSDPCAPSSDEALDDYQRQLLHEELNRLPRRYREPLILHYLLGQPCRQICTTLGVSATVLKGRLQRARHELRSRLALRGFHASLSVALVAACTRPGRASELPRELVARVVANAFPPIGAASGGTSFSQSVLQLAHQETHSMSMLLQTVSLVACVAALAGGMPRPPGANASPNNDASIQLVAAQQQNATVTTAPAAAKADKILKYDDNMPDGKKSIAGNGEMIQFSASEKGAKLQGIRLHGARYGLPQPPAEDFTVFILSEDRAKVLATELIPYARFERGESKWVTLDFAKPVDVPKTFWIVVDFQAEATKGVYVSYDSSTGGQHSMVGLPGKEAKKTTFGGDWMIQAVLAD